MEKKTTRLPENPFYFSISQLLFLHKDWLLCWSEAKVVSGRMIGFEIGFVRDKPVFYGS